MKLDLYIPGLLAAPERLAHQLELPEAVALAEWCARSAIAHSATGRYGFIQETLAVQHAPLAALAWLGVTGRPPETTLLFATPVHFQAGMRDLVLFAGPALEVSAEERARLAADIDAFFGDTLRVRLAGDEMFIEAPGLDIGSTPLHEAQGRTVRDNLPRGAGAVRTHAWMNELQMFLHGHAVNAERMRRGQPVLNGLWLWGEGDLPLRAKRDAFAVVAESLTMRGLGRLLGETRERADILAMLPASGTHVVEVVGCIDALDADDIEGWKRAAENVSANLLQPVLDWLAENRDAEAVLYAGDGYARRLHGGRETLFSRARRRLTKRALPKVRFEAGRGY